MNNKGGIIAIILTAILCVSFTAFCFGSYKNFSWERKLTSLETELNRFDLTLPSLPTLSATGTFETTEYALFRDSLNRYYFTNSMPTDYYIPYIATTNWEGLVTHLTFEDDELLLDGKAISPITQYVQDIGGTIYMVDMVQIMYFVDTRDGSIVNNSLNGKFVAVGAFTTQNDPGAYTLYDISYVTANFGFDDVFNTDISSLSELIDVLSFIANYFTDLVRYVIELSVYPIRLAWVTLKCLWIILLV